MARPGHLPKLFQAMLPEWQVRWQRHTPSWTGTLALTVGEDTRALESGPDGVRLCEHPRDAANAVTLSPQVFTQLLFGYRPAHWAAEQSGQQVPEEHLSLLDTILTTSQAWIAGSDAF